MQIATSYSSAALSVTGVSAEASSPASGGAAQRPAAHDRVAVSDEARQLSFSLDLQHDEAAVTIEGAQSELTAEASSTKMSFTLMSAGDSGAATGKTVHVNDEISGIAREVKPLVKKFMAAAGVHGGWGEVNRLMRSVA